MRHRHSPCLPAAFTLAGLLFAAGCGKKETQIHATIDTSMGPIVVHLLDQQAPKTVENFVGLAEGTRLLEEGAPRSEAEPFYDGLTFHRVIEDFMIQGGDPSGDGTGGPGYTFEDETYVQGEPIAGRLEDLATAEYVFEQLLVPHLREHNGRSPRPFVAELFGEMQTAQGFDPMLDHSFEEIAEAVDYEGTLRRRGELIDTVRYGTLCMANAGPNTNGSQFFIVTREGGVPSLNGRHTVFGNVISGMEVAEAISKVPTQANAFGEQSAPVEPVTIESVTIDRVKVKLEPEVDTE